MAALTLTALALAATAATTAYTAKRQNDAQDKAKKEMKMADAQARGLEQEYKDKQAKDAQTAAVNASKAQRARMSLIQGGLQDTNVKTSAMGAPGDASVVRKIAMGL